jgi:hypothetical protein
MIKQIILVILVVLLACMIGSCTSSSEIEVPINVTGASDIGSLRFELDYDATILQVREVVEGDLSSGALFDYNTDNPGCIVIGIVDDAGINGDIELAKIKFEIIQKGTECPLTVGNIFAYNANTLDPLSSSSRSGTFGGSSKAVTPPVLVFQ